MHLIGIDIGGTNIKAALFDGITGDCLEQETTPTRDREMSGKVPAWAEGVRHQVEKFERVCGGNKLPVGISAPGLANRDGSCIAWMPGRMSGIENFVWSEFLGCETHVLNDAHAALLGEVWQGAAKGGKDVLLLTLGTGVGGAAMCDGKLITGHLGRAGHFGHISLDPQGRPTIAGTPGGLENAIGNATIQDRSQGKFATTHEMIEAVNNGDVNAIEVWRKSVRALAAGVASLINCFDPETFILGGGIAAGAGDALFRPLDSFLYEMEWRPGGHRVKIVPAELGEWAGTYGAAWRVMQSSASSEPLRAMPTRRKSGKRRP
jgi:glucokinase